MKATVSDTRIDGFDAIVLANEFLRAVLIPELGGRVWELHDRVRGRQWIWHRDGYAPATSRLGDPYDVAWAGGWEELFPNDAPGWFEGRDLPDHGEWWTTKWAIRDMGSGGEAHVCLGAETSVIRTSCEKTFRLSAEAPTLSVAYRIQSREERPFHFLFKQHLAVGLTPGCRLRLSGGQVRAVDPRFSMILPDAQWFEWPYLRGSERQEIDLQRVPDPTEGLREFVYVRDLPEPWCGVDDPDCGASLRMEYNARELPFVWLFLAYGGWQGAYTGVLEPCSNLPKDLAEAVRCGSSGCLEPGGEFRTTVSVTLGPSPT